jgi:hypothetical protein
MEGKMTDNTFKNCGSMLKDSDIKNLEEDLAVSFPSTFKAHYKKFNGGMPNLDWFPAKGQWEPIWIHKFLSINPKGSTSVDDIKSVYNSFTKKGLLPKHFVPFSMDPGANLFCLNTEDASIYYWINDSFDPALDRVKNQERSERYLANSFDEFLNSLTTEDEAYG